ncbi:probable glutamate receptor [Caerostris darwini]|uniref:Probable glutamate receptor n=1 Tax=Caerostris darwini TaxID=1538125 RepID=A0AAV4WWY8_9ARAC|nr:probable glutamate receptor [Caerostris darwini]
MNKITLKPDFLKVAVYPANLLTVIEKTDEGQVKLSGAEGDFMDAVLSAVGFRYELLIPSDGEWGRLLNGNWTGMIGEVVNKRADLAWTWLSVNEERQQVVDFSTSYYFEKTTFGVVKPVPMTTAETIFYPFHLSLWICLFAIIIAMPVMFLLMKIRCSFFRLFLNVLGSVLKQPFMVKYSTEKVKILLVWWLIFTTLMTSFYSSVLLSFLTKPIGQGYVKNIRELSDAVQKGKIKCLAARGSVTFSYLLDSEEDHLRILGETMIRNSWYSTGMYEDVPTTTDENFAVVISDIFLERKNNMPGSRFLIISDDNFFANNIAVAMRKDFCCKEKLNNMITRAIDSGLTDYYLKKYVKGLDREQNEEQIIKPLSLSDISGAFYILLVGLLMSAITLLIEIYRDRRKRKALVVVSAKKL